MYHDDDSFHTIVGFASLFWDTNERTNVAIQPSHRRVNKAPRQAILTIKGRPLFTFPPLRGSNHHAVYMSSVPGRLMVGWFPDSPLLKTMIKLSLVASTEIAVPTPAHSFLVSTSQNGISPKKSSAYRDCSKSFVATAKVLQSQVGFGKRSTKQVLEHHYLQLKQS